MADLYGPLQRKTLKPREYNEEYSGGVPMVLPVYAPGGAGFVPPAAGAGFMPSFPVGTDAMMSYAASVGEVNGALLPGGSGIVGPGSFPGPNPPPYAPKDAWARQEAQS